ncbi:MAG: LON peptidase substrate-binding domain-containing protein [Alphaproteobacteria bacterium]
MARGIERPGTIPLFVLEDALLLPSLQLSLQVFEPRYLALTDYVLGVEDRLMGVIRPRSGVAQELDGECGLYDIGCAGRLVRFSEMDDGRYMISLSGVSRFRRVRCGSIVDGYRRAVVDWSEYSGDSISDDAGDLSFDRDKFMEALAGYLDSHDLAGEWESFSRVPLGRLVDAMAGLCPFSPEEKQALLEARDGESRCEIMVTLFELSAVPSLGRFN